MAPPSPPASPPPSTPKPPPSPHPASSPPPTHTPCCCARGGTGLAPLQEHSLVALRAFPRRPLQMWYGVAVRWSSCHRRLAVVRARPLWGTRGLAGGRRRPLARRLPMAPSWFNYLRPNHVAVVCPNAARCLRCHQARACKRRRSADAASPPQRQPRLASVIVINPGKGNVALAEHRDRRPRSRSSTLPGSSKVPTHEGSPFTSRSTVTPAAIPEILARGLA
jgi:hypothetical protein